MVVPRSFRCCGRLEIAMELEQAVPLQRSQVGGPMIEAPAKELNADYVDFWNEILVPKFIAYSTSWWTGSPTTARPSFQICP